MNHRTSLIFLALSLVLPACGFPKTVDSAPAVPAAASGPALSAGHDAFVAKCNGCHGYPDLATVPEDKWKGIVDRMAGKSGLSAKEGDEVLQYILAARGGAKNDRHGRPAGRADSRGPERLTQ